MTTVPAQSFSAPVRACVMAAARFMPGVCAVLMSSSLDFTTRTPSYFQFDWAVSIRQLSLAQPREGASEVGARPGLEPLAERRGGVNRRPRHERFQDRAPLATKEKLRHPRVFRAHLALV